MSHSPADLFLILHKVRGQAAFDIAERLDCEGTRTDPGPWWIIPTSGHRAYPIFTWLPDDRMMDDFLTAATGPQWEALPDHYETFAERPAKPTKSLASLMEKLIPTNVKLRRL